MGCAIQVKCVVGPDEEMNLAIESRADGIPVVLEAFDDIVVTAAVYAATLGSMRPGSAVEELGRTPVWAARRKTHSNDANWPP